MVMMPTSVGSTYVEILGIIIPYKSILYLDTTNHILYVYRTDEYGILPYEMDSHKENGFIKSYKEWLSKNG